MRIIPLLVLAALALASCGGSDVAAIGRYCNYDATSKAQYDGCVEHVSYEEIARRYEKIKPGTPEADSATTYAIECEGSSGKYSGRDNMPDCSIGR